MFHGSEAAGATFDGAEYAVEPLHEGGGDPVLPVGQDPREMCLHGLGELLHFGEQCTEECGSPKRYSHQDFPHWGLIT